MPRSTARFVPWLLILITVSVWGVVVTHDFAPVDDVMTIAQNPKLNPPRFTSDGVLWYWTHPYMGLYVPVTYTAWGLIAKATWAPTPDEHGQFLRGSVFHAASVLAHWISVLAVYAILRQLTRRTWPAVAGALLFAVHPLQVETVAWASGLKDVMSGGFSLVAIWLYLRAVSQNGISSISLSTSAVMHGRDAHATSPPNYHLWSVASLLMAMLCKPSAMVTPLIAAVLDYFILRRSAREVVRSIAPWMLMVVPLVLLAKMVQPGSGVASPPVWERPIIAGGSLAFYLGKLLLPIGLTFDYGWEPLVMLGKNWFWGSTMVPVAMGVGLWLTRKRLPWLRAAGLVSVAALLPVLGFVPFMFQSYSTVADHYMYLAMLGPAMVVAWGLSNLPSQQWRFATVACAIGLMVLAGLTIRQLQFWRNPETLLRRMIAVKPNSLTGHNGLGKLYESRHDFKHAEQEYRLLIAINPAYLPARENLVNVCRYTGRAEEAIDQVHALMKLLGLQKGSNPEAYRDAFFQLGQITLTQGLTADAVRYFQEDLRLHPNHVEGQIALHRAEQKLKSGK